MDFNLQRTMIVSANEASELIDTEMIRVDFAWHSVEKIK